MDNLSFSGYLSRYAHQLFDDLFADATKLEGRLSGVISRTQVLLEEVNQPLDATGKKVGSLTNEIDVRLQPVTRGIFDKDRRPAAIKSRYSSLVTAVPDFSGIEEIFQSSGQPLAKPCVENYSFPGKWQHANCEHLSIRPTSVFSYYFSYPCTHLPLLAVGFFFNEWKRALEEQIEKLREERKQRRAERKLRKQRLKGLLASFMKTRHLFIGLKLL